MLVLVASSGASVEVTCDASTTVLDFQKALAANSCVPTNDQLLLFDGKRLSADDVLGAYGLPGEAEDKCPSDETGKHHAKFMYLYRKSWLHGGEDLEGDSYSVTSPDDESTKDELTQSDLQSTANEELLPWFLETFQRHVGYAVKQYNSSCERLVECKKLIQEMRVQLFAVDSAVDTAKLPYARLLEKHANFVKDNSELITKHKAQLQSFEIDLTTLRETTLKEPVLREKDAGDETSEKKLKNNLLDCVPEGKILKWESDCRESHETFIIKLDDLNATVEELKQTTTLLFEANESYVDVSTLAEEATLEKRNCETQNEIVQTLDNDLLAVKLLIEYSASTSITDEDAVGVQGGSEHNEKDSSFVTLEQIRKLNVQNDLHLTRLVPEIETACDRFKEFHRRCVEGKALLTETVRSILQTVATVQTHTRDINNKHDLFAECALKLREKFVELTIVSVVPRAYEACLVESERRGTCDELLAMKARNIANGFVKETEKESERHQLFFMQHARFLPPDVLCRLGLREPLQGYEITYGGVALVSGAAVSGAAAEDGTLVEDNSASLDRITDLTLENTRLRAQVASLTEKTEETG